MRHHITTVLTIIRKIRRAMLAGLAAVGLVIVLGWTAQAAPSPLYSTLVLQNLNPYDLLHAKVTYQNPAGGSILSTTHTLQPYRNLLLNQQLQTGLSSGYAGPGLVDADGPFGVLVNQFAGTAASLGTNFRMDSYVAGPTLVPSTQLRLPQILKNVYDPGTNITWNTSYTVENANASAATLTLWFYNLWNTTWYQAAASVPAGGSVTIDMANQTSLTTLYGVGTVASTQPVTVIVHHYGNGVLTSYPASSDARADYTLYLGQLLKNVYDGGSGYYWSTGVSVMSYDYAPANVTLTYTASDGTVYSEGQTGMMVSFDQRNSAALQWLTSFYGSGVLTSNRRIVASVNTVTDYVAGRGLRSASYSGFSAARSGTRLFVPLLRKNTLDTQTGTYQSTGVVGRLVGNSATTVTLMYYFPDGTRLQRSLYVTPSSPMFTFDARSDAGLANGINAAGVISSSPPVNLMAIVSVVTDSSVLGDSGAYYEAMSQ